MRDRDENNHREEKEFEGNRGNAGNIKKHQNSDQFPWRQKKVLYLWNDRRLLKISK